MISYTELQNTLNFALEPFVRKLGRYWASLFTKPAGNSITHPQITWDDCASAPESKDPKMKRALFGISLSSVHKDATDAVVAFLIPVVLKKGYTSIYLGSPIPGFKKALEQNPELTAVDYVHKKHPKKPELPYDPQLKYYYQKGFHEIVSVQEEYFPHEKSMNYGVIIKSLLPAYQFTPLLQLVPLSWVKNIGFGVFLLISGLYV